MKIIYFTRHFNHSGYETLERLLDSGIPIHTAFFHKTKTAWRIRLLYPALLWLYHLKCWWYRCEPIKTVRREEALAKRRGISRAYVSSIKDVNCYELLKNLEPDLIVIGGGWHELIPKRVYSLPKFGCINLHPSLLPEFRGTSITRWQVLHGVTYSGCTIHYVDSEFDTGPSIASEELAVPPDTTPQELFFHLSKLGAELMVQVVQQLITDSPPPAQQTRPVSQYCAYFPKWTWESQELCINWHLPFKQIHQFILANSQESYEYAGPWFVLNGKRFILRKTRLHGSVTREASASTIYVCRRTKTSLFIIRDNDPHILELIRVQRDDAFRKLRRSFWASALDVNVNHPFPADLT